MNLQNAQWMMCGGFLLLGWVLARRQMRFRKRVNREARVAHRELTQIRNQTAPAVPLIDAPAPTLRWQTAMFDLQRELKADLDTRIAVVQTLVRQMDQRIETLESLQRHAAGAPSGDRP